MTMLKSALKAELGLDSTNLITQILKAANRPYSTQRVEDADAELVRKAIVHVRTGKSVVEAVRQVTSSSREEAAAQTDKDPAVPNDNGNSNGQITLTGLIEAGNTQLSCQQANQLKQAIQNKSTDLAEQAQEALWLGTAAAMFSPQVQNSERVTNARDFALNVISASVEDGALSTELKETMFDLGFFAQLSGVVVEASLPPIETDGSTYQEPFYSASGYEAAMNGHQ